MNNLSRFQKNDKNDFRFFKRVIAIIKTERQNPKKKLEYAIGKKIETKTREALQCLKEKKTIPDFIWPGELSFTDVMRGIDFFIVHIKKGRYSFCPLSVTGKRWMKEHQRKHSEIPVIAVSLYESQESIQEKIMGVLNKF